MASKYNEEIKYLKSIYSRYEKEEEQDRLFTEQTGDGKYIKNENEKAWNAKQKKMKLIVNIIDALSNETVGGFCKDCANYQKDKCYCEALRVYLVPDYGYCWMFDLMKEETE
jgi:hypothetical protein